MLHLLDAFGAGRFIEDCASVHAFYLLQGPEVKYFVFLIDLLSTGKAHSPLVGGLSKTLPLSVSSQSISSLSSAVLMCAVAALLLVLQCGRL